MGTDKHSTTISFVEFVALMATLTALAALSIDMILPALPAIGDDLGVGRDNDRQLVISVLFLGFAIGQLFYGPLSETTGRKPAVYAGLGLFIVGCGLAMSGPRVERPGSRARPARRHRSAGRECP